MKKMNNYLSLGLFITGVTFILNRFTGLPDFAYGLLMGTGVALELIGLYAINHDISKLKNFKLNLYRKCFGK